MSSNEESVVLKKMKLPRFGKIKIGDQKYDLLSQPLTSEKKNLVYLYKKINKYFKITAPLEDDSYEWILEDDKLYLSGVYFKKSKSANFIQKIFNQDKLEANWLNGKVKILLKNVGSDIENIKNVFTLEFKNGKCVSKLAS